MRGLQIERRSHLLAGPAFECRLGFSRLLRKTLIVERRDRVARDLH
jgi:hypothetical protein